VTPFSTDDPTRRRTGRALLGLAALVLAPFSWLWTIDQPFLRATGATAWALLGLSLALGVSAAWADRRRWVRGLAVGEGALVVLSLWLYFGVSRLPETTAGALERAPDFTLPDSTGAPVTLSAELARGPVLLVFFRGHW